MQKAFVSLALVLAIAAGLYYFGVFQKKPSAGQDAVSGQKEMLVGLWKSTEDERFMRELKPDGTAIDTYEGDASATVVGQWDIVADPAKEPVRLPDTAGATVLKIVTPNEALYFKVLSVSSTSLYLSYIDRGNTLSFTRVR